jgi:hypothetical protein
MLLLFLAFTHDPVALDKQISTSAYSGHTPIKKCVKMKILFVAPYPISRIRIRSYGFVSQLAKAHDVTVLALCSTLHEAADVQTLQNEGFHIIAVTDKRPGKLFSTII